MKKPQVQQASESLLQSTFPVSTKFVANPLTEYNALNTCNNDAFICWIVSAPCSADFTKDPYIYISCVAGLLSSLQKWFTKTFSSHGSEGACVQCFSLQLHALCSNSLSQAYITIHQCIPHIYDCQIKSHQFCISVITHCSWNSTSICGKACLGVSFSTLHFAGQLFFSVLLGRRWTGHSVAVGHHVRKHVCACCMWYFTVQVSEILQEKALR